MDFNSLIAQEEDRTRVYIAYGLVMNQIQECELGMVQMYFAIKLKKGKILNESDKNKLYKKLLKDTFGTLVKVLSDQSYLNDSTISDLQKIKKARDYFAHSFFKENLPQLKTKEGRKSIIKGLGSNYNLIERTNIRLNEEMTEIFKELNFTETEIKGFVEEKTQEWLITKK